MKTALWTPTAERAQASEMAKYMAFVNENYGKSFGTYKELYAWSVDNIETF